MLFCKCFGKILNMNFRAFLRNEKILLLVILIFVVLFSLSHLTTRPKLWFDEGIDIEIAHNFLLFQKLDISTAPREFSGLPYVVGTNGYPLTIPLAGFFGIFGFGLTQARLYMILWLIMVIVSVFIFQKKFFGKNTALITAVFIATFAPFYGDGLMATGEIPGFFFLVWGLYFLLNRGSEELFQSSNFKNYFLTGIFFALAASSKPSIYLLLMPATFIFFLFCERQRFFKKIFVFALGTLLPFLVWAYLAFPNPFSFSTWVKAASFYKYPYGQNFSVIEAFYNNFKLVFTHTTLIYFFIIYTAIFYWLIKEGKKDFLRKKLFIFFAAYSALAFLYFLKSPGWLRYILGAELFSFLFLPIAIKNISQTFFKKENLERLAFFGAVSAIIVLQFTQLFFFRSDLRSPYPEKVADYINSRLNENPEYKVGIIKSPDIASLINPLRKFHTVKVAWGVPAFGKNPLSFPEKELPKFIAFHGESDTLLEYKNVLDKKYFLINDLGGYSVYELK